jgi:hypothetical protein
MDEDLFQSRNHLDEATPPQGCLEPAGFPSADRPLIAEPHSAQPSKSDAVSSTAGGVHNLYGWEHFQNKL